MNKSSSLTVYKIVFVCLFLASLLSSRSANAQCAVLPPILSLGSNKVPNGLCSPVTANLQYTISFSAPLPAGNTYRVHFEWNDGQLPAESSVLLAAGSSNYNVNSNRTFPINSDCEYQVRMIIRVNGAACASTIQFQRIASWRTDAFNGGNIQLISPVSGTNIHLVCRGDATSVVFNDLSVFNCNSQYPVNYTPGGPFIETPNEQIRWQQITYNTPNGPPRIPNSRVNGVPVTNTEPPGGDLILNYLDPRVSANENGFGVFRMTSPVVINDPRRRPTLTITAPGGFGAGFPDVGDEIEITIRYWNFCNPYANDFDLTPVGGNNIDGDNPPITATAYIRIIDAPNPPAVAPPGPFCESDANGSFNFTATGVGVGALTYTWFLDAGLTTILQGPNADNTFNPVTEGPVGNRINKTVTGSQTFLRYVTVTQGSNNCRSPAATVTIRIDDTNTPGTIAHPLGASPITICTTDDPAAFTSTTAGTGGGPAGTFTYQWQHATAAGGPYVDLAGATLATFNPTSADVNARRFFRRRVRSGQCADVFSNVIEFRIDTPVTGGDIGNPQTICTGGNPGVLTNVTTPTGGNGVYSYLWQEATAIGGPYGPAAGVNNLITYDPPVLATTTFYRRLVTSGVCAPGSALSTSVIEVTVNQLVVPGVVNNPQTICSGQDPAILGETTPPSGGNGTTYTFQWKNLQQVGV